MNTLKLWGIRTAVTLSSVAGVMGAFSLVAYAAPNGNTPGTSVINKAQLGIFLCNIIATMFWLLIIVSVIMIIMAGFQYVLAGDDTEKTTKARKTLTYAAVGIAVALLATTFPSLVGSVFGSTLTNGVALSSTCAPF